MTAPTLEQVNAAVRAVLAGLGRGPQPLASQESRVTFAGRLFALRQAESLSEGTREIRVAAGTVVTPLAIDHLKRQGIALRIVATDEAKTARNEGEWGFAIDHETGLAVALRRSLLGGSDAWFDLGQDALSVAHWVLEAPPRGAVVLTTEASVVTWSVNQLPGIRAATVADADASARAARYLGANLLVIELAGKSIPLIKQLFVTFRRTGCLSPPAGLIERHADHANRRGDRTSHTIAQPSRPAQRPLCAGPSDDARGLDGGLWGPW